MIFHFSFPLNEDVNSPLIQSRIKAINRFFRLKADLSGKTRSFGVELLYPNNTRLLPENSDYYLCFQFRNPYAEVQKKLELMLNIGNNTELIDTMNIDICYLSRISGLSIQCVSFAYTNNNLNIEIQLSNEYRFSLEAHLEMLSKDFKARKET